MATKFKTKEEIISIINTNFNDSDLLQVETSQNEVTIRRLNDLVARTRGTIKNLSLDTIKIIAKSEDFYGC